MMTLVMILMGVLLAAVLVLLCLEARILHRSRGLITRWQGQVDQWRMADWQRRRLQRAWRRE